MRNKRLLILVSVVLVIVIIVLIIMGVSKKSDPNLVTDRDTGETISIADDPEVSDGAAGKDFSNEFVQVFGLVELNKSLKDNTGKFTDDIKPALQNFMFTRADKKITTVTIIPKNTKINGSVITLLMRLGQGNETLPVTITVSSNKKSSIIRVVDKDNKYGGDYVYIGSIDNDTMLYTISYNHNYKTSDDPILISIDTSTSYREAALDYIRSLGYSLSDFKITFINYENPFK